MVGRVGAERTRLAAVAADRESIFVWEESVALVSRYQGLRFSSFRARSGYGEVVVEDETGRIMLM